MELDESILRRPKEKKKESLEKEIFLDSFSQPVFRESQPRAEYTALAKRNFIGPPTHAGTILYCSSVGHWEAKSFRGSCYSRFLNERARGEAA